MFTKARRRIRSSYVNTGYYPGYDVLENQDHWDDKTWNVVRKRMEEVPPIRFFNEHERATYEVVSNLILDQDPARDPWVIPVVNYLDEKLYKNEGVGYRYAGTPPLQEMFRLGVQSLDQSARILFDKQFIELKREQQQEIISRWQKKEPPGQLWKRLNAKYFWEFFTHYACQIFYAHPYLWNEVGFGGPAYPLGYMRLTNGEPDPWEAKEDRSVSLPGERTRRKKSA